MSSRHVTDQLERTLQTLLPAYTPSSLPRPLVELATTLLLQSQSRAAQLKPEEEPARYSVICEIACHRLKTRLNLPKIESRPPCPPRTYKKLYQFLDRTLAAPSRRSDAGEHRKTPRKGPATPVKARTQSIVTSSVAPSSRKRKLVPSEEGLHQIQLLTPVSTPSTTPRKKLHFSAEQFEEDAIIVAQNPASLSTATPGAGLEENIEVEADESDMEVDGSAENDEDGEAMSESSPTKEAGLGSLMENRFDWLSKERVGEYTRWRAMILRRIDAVQRKQHKARVSC